MCASQCIVLRRGQRLEKGKRKWFGGKNQNSEYRDKWERSCGIFTKGKSNAVHLMTINLMYTCRIRNVWPRSCPAEKDLRPLKMENMGKKQRQEAKKI